MCQLAGLVFTGAAGLFFWSQGAAPPEPVVAVAEPAPTPDPPAVVVEPDPVPVVESPKPVARTSGEKATPAAPVVARVVTPVVAPVVVAPAAAPAPVALGTVFVNSQPCTDVDVDGKRVGETGGKGSLSVGAHQVRLETGDGRKKDLSLNVKENDVNRICWDFNTGATCSR